MATVSEKSRQTYADADEFIQFQLEQARSRIKSTDLLTAVVLTGLLMVTYILVFTLFDHWVIDGGFSPWTRAAMLAVVLSLCVGIVIRYVLRPWFRSIHPLYAARMLDKSSEGLQGSLLTLIDLQAVGRKSEESIQKTLEKRAAVRLADIHVDEAIDRKLLVRLTGTMFVITAVTCLYAVFSPKAISLLRPLSVVATNVATRTVIDNVKPGNSRVPAGAQLELVADLSGVVPKDVQVLFTTEDRRFVDEPLAMSPTDDQNRFRTIMIGEGDRGLRQNFNYRVVAGDAVSETYSIVIDQPPSAQVVDVRYKYPEYMGLPERTDASGTIEAWEGTTATIAAESSAPIQTAVLQMSDEASFKSKGEELQMEIRDRNLSAQLTLNAREDGSFPKFYRIQVFDSEGHTDPDPVVYAIEVHPDQAPVVRLHDPTRDLQVPSNAIVPLLVEAEDPDFLLRSVTLHYSVNGKPVQPAEILLDTTKAVMPKRWTSTYEFRLEPLNLKAGDVVTYHLQARDNRPPLGNQGRTGDLNLQIIGEVTDEAAQEQLAQDLAMQEQLKKDLAGQNNDGKSGDPGEQANDPPNDETPPAQNQENELPKTDPPEDGTDPARPPQNGSDSSPESQKQDGNTSEKSSNGKVTEPDSSKEGSEVQPGQNGSNPSSKRRLDEDEALVKIIEEMNRRREQSGDLDSDNEQSGNQQTTDQSQRAEPPEPGTARPSDSDDDTTDHDARKNDPSSAEDSASDKPGQDDNQPAPTSDPNSAKPEDNKDSEVTPESNPNDANGNDDSDMNNSRTSDNLDSKEPDTSKDNTPEDSSSEPAEKSNDATAGKHKDDEAQERDQKAGTDNSEQSKSNSDNVGTKQTETSNSDETSDLKKPVDASQEQGTKPGEKSQGQKKSEASKGNANKKSPDEDSKSGDMNKDEKASDEPKAGDAAGKAKDQSDQTGNDVKDGAKDGTKDKAGKKGNAAKDGNKKNATENGSAEKGNDEKNAAGKNSAEKTSDQSNSEKSESDNSAKSDDASKSSDGKSSDGKSSDGKSSDGKSSDGKSSDGKSSDGKSSDGKSSDGKSSDGKSSDGKSSDGKSGGGKPGGKPGEGKSTSGASKGGPKGTPTGKSGPGKNSGDVPLNGGGMAGDQQASDDTDEGGDGGESSDAPAPANDPAVDETAAAASLALKRLEKELDRGTVDPKLLEELGWTVEELAAFKEQLKKQLEERELNEQQQKERSLSQKSFEEMLKSIDVKSSGTARDGRTDRDRDQQDTTNRQPVIPKRYQQWYEMYQRSISEDAKPQTK